MVTVRHILSDGREVASIAGRLIRREDAPAAYALIDRINKENGGGKRGNV